MPEPTSYSPGYDFTASDKGPELNNELDSVAAATEAIVQALGDIRRSDGGLQNGIVKAASLHPSAVAAFGPDGVALAEAAGQAADSADEATASASAAAASATAAGVSAASAGVSAASAGSSATAAAGSAMAAAASADVASTRATEAAAAGTTAGTSAGAAAGATAAQAVLAALPAFSAHMNGVDQTGLVTATWTKLLFGTEVLDTGSHYDVSTSRWTPPSGVYRISGAAQFEAGTVDARQYAIGVYKNGSLFRMFGIQASGTTDQAAVNGSCLVQANGTDYFELWAIGYGDGNKTVSGAASETWFEGSAL